MLGKFRSFTTDVLADLSVGVLSGMGCCSRTKRNSSISQALAAVVMFGQPFPALALLLTLDLPCQCDRAGVK